MDKAAWALKRLLSAKKKYLKFFDMNVRDLTPLEQIQIKLNPKFHISVASVDDELTQQKILEYGRLRATMEEANMEYLSTIKRPCGRPDDDCKGNYC